MAFPVTLNGRTYTLTDFEGTNYVDGLPDAFEDFVTHAGDIYNSTSTTSNSIGTGSKTFTVEANKPYQAGTPLRIADAAAPSTNFLDTVVTSYSGTTLVVNSIGYGGSGTKTSWTVNIGGAKTVDGTLGLSQGGTGATDAAGARTNIDVYSKADADSRFLNVSGEASDVTITGTLDAGTITADGLTVDKTATISTTDYYASSTFSGTLKGAANNTKAALLLNSVSSSGQNAFASIHSEPISDFRASLIGTYSADGSGAGYFSIKQFLPTSSSTLERMRISSDGSCRWTPDGTNPDMTLDASGNLLVGQTSLNYNTIGGSLSAGGTLRVCSDSYQTATFNRKTSDGDIAIFYKDGATVGSISTQYSGLNIDGAANRSGIYFASASLTPRFNGAQSDNTIDLGSSAQRFNDAYLGGGVYLGGTGAANKLDDYEEGDWTPAIEYSTNGTLSVTYSQRNGKYTKVGQNVTIFGLIRLSAFSKGTASGNLYITGLPFSSTNVGHRSAVPFVTYRAPFNGPGGFGAMVDNGVSYISCVYSRNNNTWTNEADPDGNSEYFFEVTYRTDA